jgi:hypothetical protein
MGDAPLTVPAFALGDIVSTAGLLVATGAHCPVTTQWY